MIDVLGSPEFLIASSSVIASNIDALDGALVELTDIPITTKETPEQDRLFHGVGNHFLTLGGNLSFQASAIPRLTSVESSSDTAIPLDAHLLEKLTVLDTLALRVGQDDLFLEREPEDGNDQLTPRQKADVVLDKLDALEDFRSALSEITDTTYSDSTPPEIKIRIQILQEALAHKMTLLDKYQKLRQTPTGKRLGHIVLGNTIVAIGGVGIVSVGERHFPGLGDAIKNIPALGWTYSKVLVGPEYKVASAALAVFSSPFVQKWFLRRSRNNDKIKFTYSDEPIQEVPPAQALEEWAF